jgi:hypothetical protein
MESAMTDEPDDNVPQRDPAPRELAVSPAASVPAKSGGGGSTVAVFLSFIALAASVGSTGWMLTRVQPAVRESAAAATALTASVKAATAASGAAAASFEKLSVDVAALRTEVTGAAAHSDHADALDKRISQVEASLGALARIAAADMAVRSLAAATSGAVLAQNEVTRLVTLGASIPETAAAAADLGAALPGGAISRQSLKADLSRIAGRIEETAAPHPQTAVHTVQTFINRTVTDVGETLGLPLNQQSPAASLRDAYRSVDSDLASAIRVAQSSELRLQPAVADWLVHAKSRLAFEQSLRRLADALVVVRQADKT